MPTLEMTEDSNEPESAPIHVVGRIETLDATPHAIHRREETMGVLLGAAASGNTGEALASAEGVKELKAANLIISALRDLPRNDRIRVLRSAAAFYDIDDEV